MRRYGETSRFDLSRDIENSAQGLAYTIKGYTAVHRFLDLFDSIGQCWAGKQSRRRKGEKYRRRFDLYYSSYHINPTFYLSHSDRIRDVYEILEPFVMSDDWNFSHNSDDTFSACRRFTFRHVKDNITVVFEIYFRNSQSCKVVGTGEFTQIEKTKVVCA